MFQFSSHSALRAAQRNLTEQEICYVVDYGETFHRSGAVIYFLRQRDIPLADRRDEEIVRLAGTAVVLSSDDRVLVTVWRNKRSGRKVIRRKPDYSIHDLPDRTAVL